MLRCGAALLLNLGIFVPTVLHDDILNESNWTWEEKSTSPNDFHIFSQCVCEENGAIKKAIHSHRYRDTRYLWKRQA